MTVSATPRGSVCAACPVERGECPRCGTFWIKREGDKPVGLRPALASGLAWAQAVLANPEWAAVELSGMDSADIAEMRRVFETEPREAAIERRVEALRAELAGVRSGVLPEIERRRFSPDGSRTPGMLAQALDASVQAVNNQCARMVRAGVLTRARHNGRCFTYQLPDAVPLPGGTP